MTMRKISFIAALVVAMAAVSCVKEMQTETPAPEVNGAVTFEASFGAVTKAVLEPDATESKVAWEAGDQVGVFAGEGNFLYKAQAAGYSTKLLTEETGVPAEGPYYAVYPYDADAVLAEGVVTTTLPAIQTAVLGSFTTHLSVAQAVENKFAFKNVCGLVGVKIDAENVTKIVLEGNNGEIVAGAINVTVAGAPTWTAVAEQGATTVTLAPTEGTLAKGVYYFAVLPQTFEEGFNVKAYKGDDAFVLRNVASAFTLDRSDIVGSKAFGIEGEGTETSPYILKTPQDMVDMRSLAKLGGETWFKMANDINLEGINWVPVNAANSENFNRKIHFDGGDFTIYNLTSDKSVHGSDYPSFMGVVYGSVKNLKFDNAVIKSTSGCGVVGGYVGTSGKDGLVENVTVTNSSVTNSGDRAGGICGTARQATFKNVSFQGTVTSTYVPDLTNGSTGDDYARSGGFVGYTQTSASFENCSVDVTVEGAGNCIGGFAGYVTGTTTFKDCVNNKAIVTSTFTAGQAKTGGFVGAADSGQSFTNCDAEVSVTVSNSDAGGFAGYIAGTHTFTDCDVKTTLVSKGSEKNRCGGFVGWNAGTKTTYTNCHVLEGSTLKDESTNTASHNGNYGGFIGYGDTTGTELIITGCSAIVDVDGGSSLYNSCFVSYLGYKSTTSITDSYAVGNVTTRTRNYTGGLIAATVADAEVTITNCHYIGTVDATGNYVGGIVGGPFGKLVLSKTYSAGTVKGGSYVGGLIGAAMNVNINVTDCYSASTITTTNQQCGGLVGTTTTGITIARCYASGNVSSTVSGSAGIIGRVQKSSSVTDCIAWNAEITCGRTAYDKYAPGAIAGCAQEAGTYANCWRRADMTLTDPFVSLWDQPDYVNAMPPLPSYSSATHQQSYHGKAAGAEETLSQVALRIGWSEDIWDLSGDVPALK